MPIKIFEKLTQAFPFWILSGALTALFYPPLFTWFSGPFITLGLGVIMLGMGLTLTPQDFQGVFTRESGRVWTGILLQYTVMPFLGWPMGYVFRLPAPYAVGLVLVACCPGGTASNVVTYLARAHVPLSVTMTAISTLLAGRSRPL